MPKTKKAKPSAVGGTNRSGKSRGEESPYVTRTIDGRKVVLVPVSAFKEIMRKVDSIRSLELPMPELPPADEDGNRPALETVRAVIARGIIQRRSKLGVSQAELARKAGVPVETLNRIERAERAPSAVTAAKIESALAKMERAASE